MGKKQNEQPSYYAILEADVRYDKNLSSTAKLIYAEITALTQKEGYAWASNKWFADNFGISPSQVSRIVSQLVEAGYIDIEVKDKYLRKITLRKNRIPLRKNAQGVTQKAQTPPTQKAQDNNTSVNNKLNKGESFNNSRKRASRETAEKVRLGLAKRGLVNKMQF